MGTIKETKKKVFLSSSLLIVIFFVLGYYFLNYQFDKLINDKAISMSKSTKQLFNKKLFNQKNILTKKLSRILSSDILKKAILQKDVYTIDKLVKKDFLFEQDIDKNIKTLSFYAADKSLIYSLESNNSNFSIINDSNVLQKPLSGFEYTDKEMLYVVTKPVFYKNKYLGIVQISTSPIGLIEDISSIFKVKSIEVSKQDSIIFKDELRDSLYISSLELKDHHSQVIGRLIIIFDISDFKNSNKHLINILLIVGIFIAILIIMFAKKGFDSVLGHFKKQTYTDSLTGLGNRQALDADLSKNRVNVLILCNIKEFSLINELYGISVGNHVLKVVSKEFKKFAKKHSMIAYRISSDEFGLLKYDEYFFEDDYLEILEELHSKISTMVIEISELSEVLQVETYIGVSNGNANENLVEKSQMALKSAKEKSLPFMAYTNNIDTKQKSSKIIKMKKTIKHALENKNVVPFFQEIRDRDEKIIKYEALVRIVDIEDGEEKILYPGDFLSIALNGGLYSYVAIEVLERTLMFFANREEKISINFLPNDFFQPKLIDAFIDIVEKFPDPKRIVVEITEEESIEDFNRLIKIVRRFRKVGVKIAIDDFGTGYANYAHILKLKPDYLKIDGSLVKSILDSKDSRILVKSIVRFAQDLGIKIIAEYVENKEIFEALKEYGVDEYQGYYFGKAKNLLNMHY